MTTTRYRWQAVGPEEPFPTDQLTRDDVPPPLVRVDDAAVFQVVNQFAHTFNGYQWAGSLEELGELYHKQHRDWMCGSVLTEDPDALRGYLFYWFRADRHSGGYGPYPEDLVWLTALLDALRRTLLAADS